MANGHDWKVVPRNKLAQGGGQTRFELIGEIAASFQIQPFDLPRDREEEIIWKKDRKQSRRLVSRDLMVNSDSRYRVHCKTERDPGDGANGLFRALSKTAAALECFGYLRK